MNSKDAWKDARNLDDGIDVVPFEYNEGEFNCPCSYIEDGDIEDCTECPFASEEELIVMNVVCKGEKPSYTNEYAAGLDIRANEGMYLYPCDIKDIEIRLAVEIPPGHFGMVVARSGLSFKHQVKLINDVGIIDEDYRGDIGIRLINEGDKPYMIEKGDRIAQMIIIPYVQVKLNYVDELSETSRGAGGFGHTGR